MNLNQVCLKSRGRKFIPSGNLHFNFILPKVVTINSINIFREKENGNCSRTIRSGKYFEMISL